VGVTAAANCTESFIHILKLELKVRTGFGLTLMVIKESAVGQPRAEILKNRFCVEGRLGGLAVKTVFKQFVHDKLAAGVHMALKVVSRRV
jgi:hypothetical protein